VTLVVPGIADLAPVHRGERAERLLGIAEDELGQVAEQSPTTRRLMTAS
jgi:hypothetical protein